MFCVLKPIRHIIWYASTALNRAPQQLKIKQILLKYIHGWTLLRPSTHHNIWTPPHQSWVFSGRLVSLSELCCEPQFCHQRIIAGSSTDNSRLIGNNKHASFPSLSIRCSWRSPLLFSKKKGFGFWDFWVFKSRFLHASLRGVPEHWQMHSKC